MTDIDTFDADTWLELTSEADLYSQMLAELKAQLRDEQINDYTYE